MPFGAQYGDVAVSPNRRWRVKAMTADTSEAMKVLIAQCHQERAAHARNDHFFSVCPAPSRRWRMRRGNGRWQRDGFKQFAAVLGVFAIDAVCDDFGVGLRFEGVTQGFEAFGVRLRSFR